MYASMYLKCVLKCYLNRVKVKCVTLYAKQTVNSAHVSTWLTSLVWLPHVALTLTSLPGARLKMCGYSASS